MNKKTIHIWRHHIETVDIEDQDNEEEEVDHDSCSGTTKVVNDIWSEWESFINDIKQNGDIYEYSSLHFNIIRIGYGLKPMKDVPYDLYYDTINSLSNDSNNNPSHYSNNVMFENEKYIDEVLEPKSLEKMKINIKTKSNNVLLESIFTVVANMYDSQNPSIKHSEPCYSFFLVWSCLKSLTKSINTIRPNNLQFYPGEENLQCMLSQLKKS
ncbi:unnamed protein product [Cunninghamella blakesleeana]